MRVAAPRVPCNVTVPAGALTGGQGHTGRYARGGMRLLRMFSQDESTCPRLEEGKLHHSTGPRLTVCLLLLVFTLALLAVVTGQPSAASNTLALVWDASPPQVRPLRRAPLSAAAPERAAWVGPMQVALGGALMWTAADLQALQGPRTGSRTALAAPTDSKRRLTPSQ